MQDLAGRCCPSWGGVRIKSPRDVSQIMLGLQLSFFCAFSRYTWYISSSVFLGCSGAEAAGERLRFVCLGRNGAVKRVWMRLLLDCYPPKECLGLLADQQIVVDSSCWLKGPRLFLARGAKTLCQLKRFLALSACRGEGVLSSCGQSFASDAQGIHVI